MPGLRSGRQYRNPNRVYILPANFVINLIFDERILLSTRHFSNQLVHKPSNPLGYMCLYFTTNFGFETFNSFVCEPYPCNSVEVLRSFLCLHAGVAVDVLSAKNSLHMNCKNYLWCTWFGTVRRITHFWYYLDNSEHYITHKEIWSILWLQIRLMSYVVRNAHAN